MSEFENNIMPKLANEYKDNGNNGNKKVPFDLQKIRALGRDKPPGFATQAWEQIDLQDSVNTLETNGLIDKRKDGKYEISDDGIKRYVE